MIYLIQVTLYTAILYMVYLLFLKNRSDHNWSRAYLLLNMVLPFVLPLISMPVFEHDSGAVSEVVLPVLAVGTELSEKTASISVLPIIYVSICSLLLGYFIAQAVQIALFIRRHSFESKGDIRLIRNTGMGPGSWFNYIFIPATDTDEAILEHEEAHVRHRHSYDILLMRLLQCLAWPNVALWLIAKELKTVHEFQADAVAGTNTDTYGTTLLNELFHTKHFSLSHTFFHHPIKRRIMMLQKNKSHAGKTKVVALSLLLVTSMLYVQCTKGSEQDNKKNTAEIENIAGPEMVEFDVAPEFDGDLMGFLIKNIVYPKTARDKKIEGRVMIRLGIDEAGDIITVDVLRSPDETLTKAALDVVDKMPKWKPGIKDGKPVKTSMVLPISFKVS